jgi:hypothetical protein
MFERLEPALKPERVEEREAVALVVSYLLFYRWRERLSRSHRVDCFMIHREQHPYDGGGGSRKATPGWAEGLSPPSISCGAGLFALNLIEISTTNPRLMRDRWSRSGPSRIAGR